MGNNVIQIGAALKWRGTWGSDKIYYRENIVTLWGCVFKCNQDNTQNVAPCMFNSTTKHIELTNTGVWTTLVDSVDTTNRFLDGAEVVQETGQNTQKVMSQKAVSDILNSHSNALSELESALTAADTQLSQDLLALHETVTNDIATAITRLEAKSVVAMEIDNETGDLSLLYDDASDIYDARINPMTGEIELEYEI